MASLFGSPLMRWRSPAEFETRRICIRRLIPRRGAAQDATTGAREGVERAEESRDCQTHTIHNTAMPGEHSAGLSGVVGFSLQAGSSTESPTSGSPAGMTVDAVDGGTNSRTGVGTASDSLPQDDRNIMSNQEEQARRGLRHVRCRAGGVRTRREARDTGPHCTTGRDDTGDQELAIDADCRRRNLA